MSSESRALADVASSSGPRSTRGLVRGRRGAVRGEPGCPALLRSGGLVASVSRDVGGPCGRGEGRPLLGEIPLDTLRELADERAVAYEAAATAIVDVDDLTAADVVDAVLRAVGPPHEG